MPEHPFVLVDNAEISVLRGELAKGGWKADLYNMPDVTDTKGKAAGIKTSADCWLKREIIIPDYGGHYHHFFCNDGTRLQVEPDYPYHPGLFRCPACGKQYEGERYEAAFKLEVQEKLGRAAEDLALVYALENKPEYADKCAEILLKFAAAYPGPHVSQIQGGIMYQSLNEAVWVVNLARAYDLIYNHLKEDERGTIERFLRTVASGLQNSKTGGNWLSWHLSAVGVVGYATQDQALVDWAVKLFKKQIHKELGSDGIWPESIHGYHFYVIQAFANLAVAARHAGLNLYKWEPLPGKSFMTMFSAPLAYAYPDKSLPAINDGWFNMSLRVDLYELAYKETGDAQFAWVIANDGTRSRPVGMVVSNSDEVSRIGRYAFLFGKDIDERIEKPRFRSVNYPGLGISVLRAPEDESILTFHYGPFIGHGHPDKLAITLYANGRLWAADYGTSGYGSAIFGWHRSVFSHNTVVVDNKQHEKTDERIVSVWSDDGLSESVESRTDQACPGVSFTRTVCRIGSYYVIRDRLSGSESHTYDFYFHADGRFGLDGVNKTDEKFEPPMEWITNAEVYDPLDVVKGRWEWASQGVSIWMTGSSPITPVKALCPSDTAVKLVPLLIARQTGKSAEFITVLYPHRGSRAFTAAYKDSELRVRHDGYEDTIVFSDDEKRPTVTRIKAE